MPQTRAITATDAEAIEPAASARPGRTSTAAALFSQPLAPMLTVLGVTVMVIVAISTARTADMIAALWAANGLAVAVWLRSGRGIGYDLAFGGLMAFGVLAGEFLAGNGPILSIGFTAINMLEITLAVWLARRFAPTLNLATVEGACRFILCTAVVAPAIAGLASGIFLFLLRGAPFLPTFQTWWFGHALGLAVIGSFILALDMRAVRAMFNPWRAAERCCCSAC